MKNQSVLIISVVSILIGVAVGYVWQEKSDDRMEVYRMSSDSKMEDHDVKDNDMSMEEMMSAMNAGLEGKTGDDFDKAFISEMVMHHQGAVEMAEMALKNAKHQEIKDLASAIISAQKKEISEMKSWQKEWYEADDMMMSGMHHKM